MKKKNDDGYNVFVSWSGARSHGIAQALHDWLPNIIQAARPWLSSEDINKGKDWGQEIKAALDANSIGIVCVTDDNHASPWLNWEAGALTRGQGSKSSYVCTYFVGLKPTDIKGPLPLLQATEATKDDTLKLMKTINRALGGAVEERRLQSAFEKFWPDLDERIRALPAPTQKIERPNEDKIDEILGAVRTIQQNQNSLPDSESVRKIIIQLVDGFFDNAHELIPIVQAKAKKLQELQERMQSQTASSGPSIESPKNPTTKV